MLYYIKDRIIRYNGINGEAFPFLMDLKRITGRELSRLLGLDLSLCPTFSSIINSSMNMDKIVNSLLSRNNLFNSPPIWDIVSVNNMAITKCVVAEAGLNPSNYNNMDDIVYSSTVMDTVVKNARCNTYIFFSNFYTYYFKDSTTVNNLINAANKSNGISCEVIDGIPYIKLGYGSDRTWSNKYFKIDVDLTNVNTIDFYIYVSGGSGSDLGVRLEDGTIIYPSAYFGQTGNPGNVIGGGATGWISDHNGLIDVSEFSGVHTLEFNQHAHNKVFDDGIIYIRDIKFA